MAKGGLAVVVALAGLLAVGASSEARAAVNARERRQACRIDLDRAGRDIYRQKHDGQHR